MNKYLVKIAKKVSNNELKPQQIRAIEKLMKNRGVLLAHSTGSGKTRTLLEAAQRIQKEDKDSKQLFITPASLTSNIGKENTKHKMKLDNSRIETISYEKALNDIERLSKNKYSFIGVDEGHKLRNTDTKRYQALEKLISNAKYRMVSTATPIYNSPENISPLVNMVAGKDVLPTDKKEFEKKYISRVTTNPGIVAQFLLGRKSEEKVSLHHKKELQEHLSKYVDYYDSKEDPEAQDKFPTVSEKTFEVNMSKDQERIYKYLEGNIPFITRMKIRRNLPLDKKEAAGLNAFSSGVRQVSNSTRPYYQSMDSVEPAPKLTEAVKKLREKMDGDKNFRGVVYSNYLRAGVNDYSEELKKHGIKHSVYTGGLSKTEKDQMVKDYNEGKSPVLVVSSSGAEGLDLKGTKLTQILEPHFNKSKIDQVKGRGARYGSHSHLPKEERTMEVQHFISTLRPGFGGGKNKSKSIDQYLQDNSQDKNRISQKIMDLMKE